MNIKTLHIFVSVCMTIALIAPAGFAQSREAQKTTEKKL